MQPDFLQPLQPQEPPKKSSRKTIVIGIVVAIAVVVLGVGIFLLVSNMQKSSTSSNIASENTSKLVEFGTAKNSVSYAGEKVYDACNMVPISLFKTHIENYNDTFNSMGGDKRLNNPLVIDHGYIDRNIPQVLGRDGTAREPSISVGEKSIDTSIRAHSFMNIGNSYCTYGQGKSFDSTFGETFVIQPPTPLPDTLITYLAELKAKGKLAIESQGVQVYIEPVQQGDQGYTTIFKKNNTVVFFSSLSDKLVQAASDEIVKKLAAAPTGPMTATYPSLYSKLINACDLLPASDFEKLLGKPASSLATETLTLTESEPNTARRSCDRIEVERLDKTEISDARISLTESRTDEQTKARLNSIKNEEGSTATALKDLGDEAYVITTNDKNYSIVIRSGKVLLIVESDGESKEASADTFTTRVLPVAKTIFSNYKK